MLLESGIGFIVAGALIVGFKTDEKMRKRLKDSSVKKTVLGNLGVIFFIIGLVLLIAGVVDLYY